MEIVEYTYSQFRKDLENLPPLPSIDAILAIARGGLTFAHHLAEKLEIREVGCIGVSSYENRRKVSSPSFSTPLILPSGKEKILIVDDISDTGETLSTLLNHLKNLYPTRKFFTFTLFVKPTTSFLPDFYLHTTPHWVSFFWEKK